MILLVHCQLDTSSSWVTTGANTIVPNPEPHVEIPGGTKRLKKKFFCKYTPTANHVSEMNVTNLTGDKRSLFLEPVANSSDGRNIHEPKTEATHDPIGDL